MYSQGKDSTDAVHSYKRRYEGPAPRDGGRGKGLVSMFSTIRLIIMTRKTCYCIDLIMQIVVSYAFSARSQSAGPAGRSPWRTARQTSKETGWRAHQQDSVGSGSNSAPLTKPAQRHPRPSKGITMSIILEKLYFLFYMWHIRQS